MQQAPLRRDAADNRRRLIAAAVDVFNDAGTDASVTDIADRAGVGVGTIYRCFPTKDALIAHLVEQLLTDLTDAAVEAEAIPDGSGLERFLHNVGSLLAAHRGCLQRLWDHTRADPTGVETLRRHIAALVEAAHAAGAIRSDVTAADVTAVIWSMQGVIANAGDQAEAACFRVVTLTFAGLAAR